MHKNRFTVSGFSPDGQRMLSVCADGTLQSWRLDVDAPGECVGWHQESVTAAAYSPDGNFIASSQDTSGLIRIWQLAAPPKPKEIPVTAPSSFKVSADAQLVIPSGHPFPNWPMPGTRVYNLKTAEPVGPELQPGGAIVDAEFAPDGSWVALAVATTENRKNLNFAKSAGTGNLQLWDFKTGRQLGEPVNLPAEPRGIAVHPDGRWIACFDAKRNLIELNVEDRKICLLHTGTETFGTGDIKTNGCCRYSPDGKILVAWGMRRRALIWDHATRQEVGQWARSLVPLDIDFHGDLMAWVTIHSQLHFLSIPGCEEVVPALTGDGNWLFSGRFNAAGDRFLSAGRSGLAHVREWRENRLIAPAMQHEGEAFSGVFINHTTTVVTGGLDSKLSFWDQNTGLQVRPALNQNTPVIDLAVTSDGQTLIRGELNDRSIAIYDVPALLPSMNLSPQEALLLAEIDAGAEITHGGLVPISGSVWLAKWREFRMHHPYWFSK
jgi:WD40 repeat protein